MKNTLFLIIIFVPFLFFGQKQASNWHFGFGAGITFNQDQGTVSSINGSINTYEGCSSISDKNGNLLFTTDGVKVFDKTNKRMPNGDNLLGNPSSSQSAIIVPKPKNKNVYYIFTVGTALTGGQAGGNGLHYSEVDMTLNNGLGDLSVKNVKLLEYTSEKISAVLKDCKSDNIWVITLSTSSRNGSNGTSSVLNTFHAFEITELGVTTNSVRTRVFHDDPVIDPRGYLKLSPDGTKLAVAHINHGLFLYEFDTMSGKLFNEEELEIRSRNTAPYGLEFSPNSKLLYVSTYNNISNTDNDSPELHASSLIQYDVSQSPVSGSQILIEERQLFRGALQLGPDGRIYRALNATYEKGLPYLGVINSPNKLGKACNYEHNAINLSPNLSTQGLPPFIQSFFNVQIDIINNGESATNLALCSNETYTLNCFNIPGATYTWKFNDVELTNNTNTLNVSNSGHYQVLIEQNNGSCDIEGEAFVTIFDTPVAHTPKNVEACADSSTGIVEFDFKTLNKDILQNQNPKSYKVKFYSTEDDRNNDKNEIKDTYKNKSNLEEIFIRVIIDRNPDCYDDTSFFIKVFNTPIAHNLNEVSVCDNDNDGNSSNGFRYFNLFSLNKDVLKNQNSTDYTISYHKNEYDATQNLNKLPSNYYNKTSFHETIYIRVENNLKPDCFDISFFEYYINPLPFLKDINIVQCDNNLDSITTFSLKKIESDILNLSENLSVYFYSNIEHAKTNNISHAIQENLFNNTSNPQTLYLTLQYNDTKCFSISKLNLKVASTNTEKAILNECDNDGNEDGFFKFDLNKSKETILKNTPNNLNVRWYISYEDALFEENELPVYYKNYIPYNQTIYSRVNNNNGCYGISEVELIVSKLPSLTLNENIFYCINNHPETIKINAGIENDSPSNYTYLWTNNNTTLYENQINTPGKYEVLVTNANGCSTTKIITVKASDTATINNIKLTEVSNNNTVNVMASGAGIYEYALFNENNSIYRNYQESSVFNNIKPGIYTLYVKDLKNNCGEVTHPISVIGFPKFFTPNNDGFNDTWQVYGVSNTLQNNSKILIFDRYGKLIKQLNPTGNGWDGLFNGEKLPADDYWFSITLEDGRIFKNHFTLKY